MIFEQRSFSEDATAAGYERLERHGFVAIWRGFLFVRGEVAGRDSVCALLSSFRRLGPEATLALAKGSFLLGVFDCRSGEIFACVDPFGLTRLFATNELLSDDLFELIARSGYDENHLDLTALAFFLRFGFYGMGRTIDRRVQFAAGDEIAHLSSSGDLDWLRKTLPDFRNVSQTFDFDAWLRDVRIAVREQRISLDLTGGYDSRLLAGCLKESLAETATTGQPGNLDVAIAGKVAAALKLPHITTRHDISGFAERAPALLRLTHGQTGLLTYDHVYQLTRERQARGITLVIAGIGGELWKDILWLQDFPFLSGPPDFERLFRMRLEPRALQAAPLEPEFMPSFAAAKEIYLREIKARFGELPRTAAYDSVYAFLRIPYTAGPSVTAGIRMGVPTFSPLYDPEGALASMRKLPRERLFARWHRHNIARYAPEIAKLRADDGFSARSGLEALADIPSYLGNKVLRAAQKIAQRFGLPDIRHLSLDDPATLATARALPVAIPALDRMRELHVLARGADAAQCGRALFDRLLTSGMTLDELARR
ncbi:MAG TPA: asparagine synthase-related protein [Rhizomicrobium sp.]|jgi:hypothetical protein|nr:asparagine synthase-related protein [Rhizomicrobium sp.]